MRAFKSDGRYNLHSQGFHHIVQFRWHSASETKLFNALTSELTETYGPLRSFDQEKRVYHWNSTWRYEANRSAKRRRIYLKDESVLTLALLKIGVENGS